MTTKVYFATNRDRKGTKFGSRFNADGPHFYSVGTADVTWKNDGDDRDWDEFTIKTNVAPEKRPGGGDVSDIPEMHIKDDENVALGSTGVFKKLRSLMMKGDRDIIIFVHGFASTFESSIARAAQLAETYKFSKTERGKLREPIVFVFSWPSNGKVQPPWNYADDRDDAALSRSCDGTRAAAPGRLPERRRTLQGADAPCHPQHGKLGAAACCAGLA